VAAAEPNPATRVARSDGVIAQRLLDETVILDPHAGSYLRLNPSGSWIWERLADPQTVEELAQALATEYGLEGSRAEEDVVAFARDLAARGLAELTG
jgi:hypothetical protein